MDYYYLEYFIMTSMYMKGAMLFGWILFNA